MEQNRCRSAKDTADKNKNKLARLSEINRELGKEEHDGIDPVFLTDVPEDRVFFPKRFADLCKLFEGYDSWKKMKNTLKNEFDSQIYDRIMGDDDPHKRFLKSSGGIAISCNYDINGKAYDEILVFLPYCVIEYSYADMWLYYYDHVSASFEYVTFESESEYSDFEEIGNRYLHENKDGTKSLRYSYNPLIHIYQKPVFRIKLLCFEYSKTVLVDDGAADSIKAHVEFLTTLPYETAY